MRHSYSAVSTEFRCSTSLG